MKKPGMKAATPNEESSNGLYNEAGHELLTKMLNDPATPNALVAVVVITTTEAGGHDENGNPITKYRLQHIEPITTETDRATVVDVLTRAHENRTNEATVPALAPPTSDDQPALEGLEAEDDSVE